MNCIVYSQDPGQADRWARACASQGFEASVATALPDACEAGHVICCAAGPEEIRAWRRLVCGGLIAVVPEGDLESLDALLEAGADDVVPEGIEPAWLAARLRITERKVREAQSVGAARMMAGMQAAIRHEYGNYLAAIQGNAELALLEPGVTEGIRRSLEQVLRATARASELTWQLGSLTRNVPAEARAMNVSHELRSMETLLRLAGHGRVQIEDRLPASLPMVFCDVHGLRRLLAGLASLLAGGDGVRSLAIEAHAGASDLTVTIGPLPPSLAISEIHSVIRESRLPAEFHPGPSLLIRLATVTRPETQAALPVEAGAKTILLVDDEDSVRFAAYRLLTQAGHTVLEAASAEEGFDLYLNVAAALDGVVVDLSMEGMEEGELIRRMRELRPELRVVVWSGYESGESRRALEGIRNLHFVEKPAQLADVVPLISRLLEETGDQQPPEAK